MSCVPAEAALSAIPTIKRRWRARNTLGSKLSERRAKLKREGIIADTLATDESSSDDDGNATELSVWCNGEKKSVVRDKMFSARQAAREVTVTSRSKTLGRSRSLAGTKGTDYQRQRRTRATGLGWPFRRHAHASSCFVKHGLSFCRRS